jgi:type III secretory pathway component EscV
VAHEAYKIAVEPHVGQNDCIVVINGLPRARHTADPEDDVETVLRAVARRVAACEQEASPELLDLTWTQGFLENAAETQPNLVDAVRHRIPDEVLALAFGCLAEAGISVRHERLLDAMLDYVDAAPDPSTLDAGAARSNAGPFSPYALTQHVRLKLPETVVRSFAAGRPTTMIVLDADLERRLRTQIAAAVDHAPAYRVPEAAALLRQLGVAVSRHDVSRDVAVVTARDLRRHVNVLVGAQFPTVAVLAREEAIDLDLAGDGRLEGEPGSAESEAFDPAPLLEEVSLAAEPLTADD